MFQIILKFLTKLASRSPAAILYLVAKAASMGFTPFERLLTTKPFIRVLDNIKNSYVKNGVLDEAAMIKAGFTSSEVKSVFVVLDSEWAVSSEAITKMILDNPSKLFKWSGWKTDLTITSLITGVAEAFGELDWKDITIVLIAIVAPLTGLVIGIGEMVYSFLSSSKEDVPEYHNLDFDPDSPVHGGKLGVKAYRDAQIQKEGSVWTGLPGTNRPYVHSSLVISPFTEVNSSLDNISAVDQVDEYERDIPSDFSENDGSFKVDKKQFDLNQIAQFTQFEKIYQSRWKQLIRDFGGLRNILLLRELILADSDKITAIQILYDKERNAR